MNFAIGFVFLAPVVYFFSDFEIRLGNSLLAVIYVGVFEVGITYILWLKAMNYSTNNAKIGNLVFFAPFLSFIFIRFILKEQIFATTFIGLIFIISGVLVQQIGKNKKEINGE